MSLLTTDALAVALAGAALELEARADFYRILLNGTVYVLGERRGRDTVLQRWKKQGDGSEIIPFFSSLRLLEQAISTPTPYLRLNGRDLFRAADETPLILNPFSETNKDFLTDEVAMLRLDGLASVLLSGVNGKAKQHLLAGLPETLPPGLVGAANERLARHESIESAYIVQTFMPDSDAPPRLLMAIGTDTIIPNLLDELAVVFSPLLPAGMQMDLVWLDDELPLKDFLINETRPIYRKGLLGKIERIIAR